MFEELAFHILATVLQVFCTNVIVFILLYLIKKILYPQYTHLNADLKY